MSEEFSLPIRVYIEDTDAGGIVYYVNYLKYLERAQPSSCARWRERAAISDQGWMFVVSEVAVTYRQRARLDEQLDATAVIQRVGGATIDFFQSVRRGDTVLVEGNIQIACIDGERGRPRRIDPALRARLAAASTSEEAAS